MFRFFRRKQRLAKVRIVLGEDSVLIAIENASIELAQEGSSVVYRDGEFGDVRIWGKDLAFEVNTFGTADTTPSLVPQNVGAKRKRYMVWFLEDGRIYSVRVINAVSREAALAEAQRRIDEGGVIGIQEGDRGEYLFGRPGITVGTVEQFGEATELGDRDLETELEHKTGRRLRTYPDIPF